MTFVSGCHERLPHRVHRASGRQAVRPETAPRRRQDGGSPYGARGVQFRLAGGAEIWYNLRRQDKGANQEMVTFEYKGVVEMKGETKAFGQNGFTKRIP